MKSALKRLILRLLGGAGYSLIDTRVWTTLLQSTENSAAHINELSANLAELTRNLRRRDIEHAVLHLDNLAQRCLMAAPTSEARQLASHYALASERLRKEWAGAWPPDPFPGDDGTIDFAVKSGVFVPGNEVDVPAETLPLPWRPLLADPDCGVFLVVGQSNAANSGETPYACRREVFTLDFLRLRCFAAADPLPGCSAWGGSVWSRLGDKLIEQGLFRRVLFAPIAFGGSFITDWLPGGSMHRRTELLMSRLHKYRGARGLLPFTAVLWQQGEAEANHTSMTAEAYREHFRDWASDLRRWGVFAPIFVARATLCDSPPHPCENRPAIRAAQDAVLDARSAILAGPDTDSIAGAGRYDGCHFSASGLERCAELWLDILKQWRPLLLNL
jgi:hypothetical protein